MRFLLFLVVLSLSTCIDDERHPLDPTTPQGAAFQIGVMEYTQFCRFGENRFERCRFTD